MMETISARHLVTSPDALVSGPSRIAIEGGRIAGVEAIPSGEAGSLLVMPCLVNAHDHARPVRSSSFGAGGKPLEIWLHYLTLLPALDPYGATAVSLARSALGGCGVVMIHHTRVQGSTDLPSEAAEMARAARDVGLRVGLAVALKDRNPLVYGPSEPILAALPEEARKIIVARLVRPSASIAEQIAMVDAVADAAGGPDFDVQYGPTGPQWCTPELLGAVARASERSGRRVHMHCLETRYQRDWADRTFPGGMLHMLDDLGLLTPRLTLAHCTHARPDELDLLAARGVTIAVNTSSNLGIRSGVAPLAQMVARGCRVALGLDGLALDEDDDALRELRLADRLHVGTGFQVDVPRESLLAMAFANGRRSVLRRDDAGGAICEGAPADLLVLDWDRLDDERLWLDLDPLDLVFARARADHVHELHVGGRVVVRQGRALGVDVDGLREAMLERIRAAIRDGGEMREALRDLEPVIRRALEIETPCC